MSWVCSRHCICMSLLKKITTASKNHKTYQVGLLQTKAYRVLKRHTTKLLEPHSISSVEWAMLGLLYDAPKGMRLMNIADELGVEAPFVTTMNSKLSQRGFVTHTADPDDNRAKVVCLTKSGNGFVNETELYLRHEMKMLFKDISINDLLSYLQVLQKLIENKDKK